MTQVPSKTKEKSWPKEELLIGGCGDKKAKKSLEEKKKRLDQFLKSDKKSVRKLK